LGPTYDFGDRGAAARGRGDIVVVLQTRRIISGRATRLSDRVLGDHFAQRDRRDNFRSPRPRRNVELLAPGAGRTGRFDRRAPTSLTASGVEQPGSIALEAGDVTRRPTCSAAVSARVWSASGRSAAGHSFPDRQSRTVGDTGAGDGVYACECGGRRACAGAQCGPESDIREDARKSKHTDRFRGYLYGQPLAVDFVGLRTYRHSGPAALVEQLRRTWRRRSDARMVSNCDGERRVPMTHLLWLAMAVPVINALRSACCSPWAFRVQAHRCAIPVCLLSAPIMTPD